MFHDDTRMAGTVSLEGDDDGDKHLVMSGPNVSQTPAYANTHNSAVMLQGVGAALEKDDFVGNPAINALQRGISVHPLGGCCMANSKIALRHDFNNCLLVETLAEIPL